VVVKDGSGGAKASGKVGLAPTASLTGMRRSEKAEVLEKTLARIFSRPAIIGENGGQGPAEMPGAG
jgi:hypothetical protein